MQVAYLINHYPAVSHTFIRREIHALEDQGVSVQRLALRGWDTDLVDPDDIAELAKTRHTLKDGIVPLLLGMVGFALRNPAAFWRGLKLAMSIAKTGARSWPYHLVYLAHACRILGWMRAEGVTHLHAHFGNNSAEIATLARVMGGPKFSYTAHGSEVFDNPLGHALPLKARLAQTVMTSCAYIGAQMKYHIPTEYWSKVQVVHCGLGAESFTDDPAPFPEAPVFLSVGRLSPEKGHLVLLEAFAKVHAAHKDAKLVIAGDGPMRAQTDAKIAELGLQQAVRITGWVTGAEVRAELRKVRALVHPSFTEGLPVVLMEAMAEHRPVISTYIAGIPELVRDGQTGWLVPAGQVEDLADALLACAAMKQPALKKMGAAGFARVSARHDVQTEAAKLRLAFEQDADA
ncbi:MAG: glycosyltransferase, partial [Pseudomonadota bacterium]